MAPKTKTRKAAPEPVVDDAFEELEDVDAEDDVEEEAPAKSSKSKKAAAPEKTRKAAVVADDTPKMDTNWLASHVSEQTGVALDSRSIRLILRNLAADGVLAREVGTDRDRYTFPKGPEDKIVKQVVRHVNTAKTAPAKASTKKAATEVEDDLPEEIAPPKSKKSTKAATPA
jgi:hypothetical protein